MSTGGMNKRIKILLAIILLPLGVVVPVLSLESHYAVHTSAQATDSSLEQRKEAYRAKLKAEFTKADQDRLKLRCSVVQANVKNLASRLGDVQTSRTAAYDNILSNLNDLLAKLEAQSFESSTLQNDADQLDTKIETFKAKMIYYKQSVDDMAMIDCSQDPVSFKAALEVARTTHDELLASASSIRTYIANTIKPDLNNVRTQIESGQTTGGSQ